MTSVYKNPPATPKQASRRRTSVDKLLDADLFKVLAEPTRLKLLACLIKCGRACSVTEIAQCCEIDFSVVARHLASMAKAGVLESRKEGRTVWYEAPADDLSRTFRAIADAIDDSQPGACCSEDCCG